MRNYKGIKIYQVRGHTGYYDDETEISDYDLKTLFGKNISKVVYWYATGDYEGGGEALMKVDRRWYRVCLSHCSCNGPLDNMDFTHEFIRSKCTEELDDNLEPLLKYMKKYKIR